MSIASCALLHTGAAVSATDDWNVESAVMIYSESDSRVSAVEPAIYANKQLNDDDKLSLRVVIDSLTGATPTGANPSNTAQTFTSPSGNRSINIAPGQIPLDDTFHDTRGAFGVDWETALDRVSRIVLGVNGSSEFDYLSLGVSATYLQDFNDRNTTLSTGIAINNDTITPEGGIPTPFATMNSAKTTLNRDGADDSKTVTDFIIGVTQVIDRDTLVQLNFSTGTSDGYQTDPFKVLSVVDTTTGLPTNTALLNADANALPYVYEKRPDKRQRNRLFFRSVHNFDDDVLHLSYRYFWDDWDVTSHTLDAKYRYELSSGNYLQPHLRYYTQSEAEFYRHNLVQGTDVDAAGNVLVDFASSDSRLAEFDAVTLGMKYGIKLSNTSELGFRAEFISQTFANSGVPAGEETPDLSAVVLQANYRFLW